MTPIYARGPYVKWLPDDVQTAKTAAENVMGPIDSYPLDVSEAEAEEIVAEYESLQGGSA